MEMIAKIIKCFNLFLKLLLLLNMNMTKTPQIIIITPAYRTKGRIATDNENNKSEVILFLKIYELAKIRLSRTKQIKRGSDQAITDTENNGFEKTIANIPTKKNGGEYLRYLNIRIPPKYMIKPKRNALIKFA